MRLVTSLLAAAVAMAAGPPVHGQPASLTGGSYSESFDSMELSGITPPVGWSVWSLPGGSSSFTAVIPADSVGGGTQLTPPASLGLFTQSGTAPPAANNNGLNAGFSAVPPPDNRCLGTTPTSVAATAVQLWLRNQTGGPIQALSVTYSARVISAWGGNELPGYSVFFSTAGPGGPFTAAPALDAVVGSGNTTGGLLTRTGTVVLASAVPDGADLWIRWIDDNSQVGSPDQAYGVDDLAIAAVVASAGACCSGAGGVCSLAVDAASCAGTFLGLGSACTPDPCAPPSGSCCDAGGGCVVTSAAACPSGSWTAQGVCGPLSCPPPGVVRIAIVGDYGVDDANQAAVASSLKAVHPHAIATVGDNTYFTNTDITNWDRTQAKYYGQYIRLPAASAYLSRGSPVNRFFPTLGNHDWDVGGSAASYTGYFDLPGNERYYTVSSGPVDLFLLSSDPREPDSNAVGGVQHAWFTSRLAQSTAPWKIVIFHHPARSSTSGHAPSATMQGWNFQSLGVTAVVQGHNHHSERIESVIPWFVAGSGGKTLYAITAVDPDSVFRNDTGFMFLLVDADASRISFRFIDTTGAVLDTRVIEGVAACRADFNNSGIVSVQDIFDFLAAYFAGCP